MQRRDAAVIAVFRATGIRLSGLAGIRYDAVVRSIATWTCGSGRSPSAASTATSASPRSAIHAPGPWTGTSASAPARPGVAPQLWLGASNRGPVTAQGIYQMIVRCGRQCGVRVYRTGSGTISATPGWTGAARKAT